MYYASSIFAIFKSLLSVHELFWLKKKKGQTTIRRAADKSAGISLCEALLKEIDPGNATCAFVSGIIHVWTDFPILQDVIADRLLQNLVYL